MEINDYRKQENITLEEIFPLVRELTEKYTSKQSTSVSVAMAKQLLHAVLFCIQEYEQMKKREVQETIEKEKWNSGESFRIVNSQESKNARKRYQEGYQMVLSKVQKTKLIYEDTMTYFSDYGNQALHDTVLEGMPAFFTVYDPIFNPQNSVLTWDYPMINNYDEEEGIDRIHDLMKGIQLEQCFLDRFPDGYVEKVLTAHHEGYKELFINLCSIVMRNTLGHLIAGKAMDSPGFTQKELQIITDFVLKYDRIERKEQLEKWLHAFCQRSYDEVTGLYEYLVQDMPEFQVELEHAVSCGTLHRLFVY